MSITGAARPQAPRRADYGYDVARMDPRRASRIAPDRAKPRRRSPWIGRIVRGGLGIVSGLMLLGGLIALLALVFIPMGIGTSLVAFTAALVPVGIVFLAVWWIDRYTPQPLGSLMYAFAWGAVASVLLTLLFGPLFLGAIMPADPAQPTAEFLGAAIQAPVVEESMKSFGLLLLLLRGRRFIGGPIDGVVYAALMAGGFAFTENILYFGNSFHQAQAAGEVAIFWQTFFLRGLLSPFAHVSFTALCGLGLGIAAERRSLMLYFGLGAAGLAAGMLLHGLWNGSTFFIEIDPKDPLAGFLRYYATVQVPIFALLAAIVLFLRLRERRIIRRQLSDYGRAGWFAPHEVDLLVAMGRRRRAEKWAGRHGAVARMAMHDYIRTAISLAMQRHVSLHGRPTPRTRRRERETLERITADRRLIGALTAPVTRA